MLLLMALLIPSKVQTSAPTDRRERSGQHVKAASRRRAPRSPTVAGEPARRSRHRGGATGGGGDRPARGGTGGPAVRPGTSALPRPRRPGPGRPVLAAVLRLQRRQRRRATHHGVTATEIHVAFRLLNEKGFQQTLAELAGATLVDTPADIQAHGRSARRVLQQPLPVLRPQDRVGLLRRRQGSNTDELLGKGRDKAEVDATTVEEMGSFADMSATSEPYAERAGQPQDIVGLRRPVPLGEVARRPPRRTSGRSPAPAPTWPTSRPSTRSKKLCGKPATRAGGALEGQAAQVRLVRAGELLVPGVGAGRPADVPVDSGLRPRRERLSTSSTSARCRTRRRT